MESMIVAAADGSARERGTARSRHFVTWYGLRASDQRPRRRFLARGALDSGGRIGQIVVGGGVAHNSAGLPPCSAAIAPSSGRVAVGDRSYERSWVAVGDRSYDWSWVAVGDRSYDWSWVAVRDRSYDWSWVAVRDRSYDWSWVAVRDRSYDWSWVAVGDRSYSACRRSYARRSTGT